MRLRNIGRWLTLGLSASLMTLGLGRPAEAATLTVVNTLDSGDGSLRQAITNASAGDTINFQLSGCPCTITLSSGELVIAKNLSIDGPGANLLTVSGNNTSRVFVVTTGVAVELEGLQVSGGFVSGGNAFGGGIHNLGTLTVLNSIVANNLGEDLGGGIASSGTLIVRNSTFANNHVATGFGGAIIANGPLSVTGSIFTGNSASDGGGAVVSSNVSTIVGSAFFGNSALDGGAVFNGSTLTLANTTISVNSAGRRGGGIYSGNDEAAALILVNTTVSGNTSQLAGGIVVVDGNARITNGTIADNHGDQGGGISFESFGTGTLDNTIVAGNTPVDVSGTLNTTNNNLIGGDLNTILLPLANNGGPTMTHAFVANSPAIGAGDNTLLPDDTLDLDGDNTVNELLPVEQRGVGFPRIAGTNVDIGAVEAACPAVTFTPTALPNAGVGTAYSQTLGASGGREPYTFTADSLPAGLLLSSAGVLSGTPTAGGTFDIVVTATDAYGCASTHTYTLTVTEPSCAVIGPESLQTPHVATLYYQPLSVTPSGEYAFSVSEGALPPGLYLFPAGRYTFIGGFPTAPGTYTFTIKARKNNSPCESTRTYTVSVPPTVAPQLTCVVKTGSKQYTARFGYDNTTGATQTIPVGSDNYFTPGSQNRGQTTVFQPGKVTNAFSVTFTVSGKNNDLAIWFLEGPDGVKRPVNITTATSPCP